LRTLLLAYRETYARPQELRLATWEDVHAEDPKLTTREALHLGEASIILYEFKDGQRRQDTERPRVILLSPRACRLLLRLLERRTSKRGPIFLTARGAGWTANALRCRFRRLRVRLGMPRDKRGENIVPYTWRHTGATMAAAGGVRDRLLADVLGHVETKTTARYCHLQVRHLRDALGRVWRVDKR
jgi:integrase